MFKPKSKTKSAFAAVVSLLLAVGMALSAVFAGVAVNSFTAFAQTNRDNVLTFDAENNHTAQYTVPQGTAEKQYMLVLTVTDPLYEGAETEKYNSFGFLISYDRGGNTYEEYASYNSDLNAFYTYMSLVAGDVLTVRADYFGEDTVQTITATLSLEGLQIGGFNGYSLYNVRLPAAVTLNGITDGDYYASLAVEDEEGLPEGAELQVTLNGNTQSLVYDEMMGGYYVLLTLQDGQTLNFSAKAADGSDLAVAVDVVLRQKVTYSQFDGSISLRATETAVRSYTPQTTGYYVIEQGESVYVPEEGEAVVADAYYNVLLKTNPDYITGVSMVEGYPVLLAQGTTYYIEFVCAYASAETTEGETKVPVEDPLVTTAFTIEQWTGATLTPENNPVYAPVSTSDEVTYPVTLSGFTAGEYTLSVFGDIPLGAQITAHVGAKNVSLNSQNSYSAQFTLDNETELLFTSTEDFVIGVILESYEAPNYLTVGQSTQITVGPEENAVYQLNGDVTEGWYVAELSNNATVSVMDPIGNTVANAGESFGLFYVDELEIGGYILVFYNGGSESATINITVRHEANIIELDKATEIDLSQSTTYYVPHVMAGNYNLYFSEFIEEGIVNINGRPLDISYTQDIIFPVELPDEEAEEHTTNLKIEFISGFPDKFTLTITPVPAEE